MRKCIFFDRDGIANIAPTTRYLEGPDRLVLCPGFAESVALAAARGYVAVIVTNQRGIALGVVPRQTVEAIHDRLRMLLRGAAGAELLDILCCPHDTHDNCECRKPKPGMLLQAAERHDLDLDSSWMVGDHETDVWAGRNAGCWTVRIAPDNEASTADFRVPDVASLPALLSRVLA